MNKTDPKVIGKYIPYGLCVRYPPKTHSIGIWDKKQPFTYSVPALEVQMVSIYLLTNLLNYPLKRLGIPKIFSEILAGILMGPTIQESYTTFTSEVFHVDTQGIISTVVLFGYTLFMFLVGVKTDLGMVRTTGRKAFAVGISSVMVPFLIGAATVQILITTYLHDADRKAKEGLFLTLAMQSISPFAVIALKLKDLKLLNSELGKLAVSAGITSEYMSLTLTFLMKGFKNYLQTDSAAHAFEKLGLTVCFILAVITIVRPAMLWVIRKTPEGRPVADTHLYGIILLILFAGAFTHWIGEYAVLGPLIIGYAVPEGPPLGSALTDKFESFVSGLFMPLFMTWIAMRVNLMAISLSSPVVISTIIIIVLSSALKVVACVIPAWICKVPFRDALALGLIISSKGVIQMALYSFFRDDRSFSLEVFSLLVLSTAISSFIVPLCVKQLYDPSRKYAGNQKRNVMHSRHDRETRIVMCIHSSDNIPGFINLLDLSCPIRENPLMVYVLHLIELRGRANPLFISHHNQHDSENTYSEDVITAFGRHEMQNQGGIMTMIFTAVSPRKLMHEDICNLALEKIAALIVLPFHRKWALDGSVEDEDLSLRSLNCKILEMAPSSVGIFIDRGGCGRQGLGSSATELECQRVAVIFFGGHDDREALVYGQRVAKSPLVSLTVIRFIATVDDGFTEKERMLDNDLLEDVKVGDHHHSQQQVSYAEEVVRDGAETALITRELVNVFDLIIVGRHKNLEIPQISGLKEWSECPELGAIGDILASSDLKGRASVLVIQQQQNTHR